MMTKVLVLGVAIVALGCGDEGSAPQPTTAPDAGHRFVESEQPAERGSEQEHTGAVEHEESQAPAELSEPDTDVEVHERSATHSDEAPVPPPAEMH